MQISFHVLVHLWRVLGGRGDSYTVRRQFVVLLRHPFDQLTVQSGLAAVPTELLYCTSGNQP